MIKFLTSFLFSGLLGFFTFPCHAQISQDMINIDSVQQPLVFYGFDLSHLKFVSKRFTSSEMAGFTENLSNTLVKKIDKKRIFKYTGADSLTINYAPCIKINSIIIDSNLVSPNSSKLSTDSIQTIINAYEIPDSLGTGCMIIIDCFDRKTNIISIYLVLFEINSRKIIKIEHLENYHFSNYNVLKDWNYASIIAVNEILKSISWDQQIREVDSKFIDYYYNSDNIPPFKSKIFQNEKNEIPVTFGIGPVIGISESYVSGGILMDFDIYHVLLGFRYILNPLIPGITEASHNEKAVYLGYRFRKNKYSFSLGSGFSDMSIFCTSGLNTDCDSFNDQVLRSVPLFLEYTYFVNPFLGFNFSFNAAFNSRETSAGVFGGIKFGISRKWHKSYPYTK